MDRTVFKKAMELYYEMMGWDLETGAPREARLYELNIHDLSKF
jgi:aldehyde:ferredoxin oxidoreductase